MRRWKLVLLAILLAPFCAGCLSTAQREQLKDDIAGIAAGQTYKIVYEEVEKIDIHPECRVEVANYAAEKAREKGEDLADKTLPEPTEPKGGWGMALMGLFVNGLTLLSGGLKA